MARTVTVIPPTRNPITRIPKTAVTKRRVAAYARVSTDSDEQLTSYEAQIDYYTNYIGRHNDWEFVKIYTDEGISATNTKHRAGFNEMVADALAGKIDLIVTKSVSRFARNTVDSLTTVRQLKANGVEVFFEKENIYTFDGKGELLITIMSSLAQEESRSISENVTWGQRKRFADGKVSLAYKQFLGYKKGADGLPEVVPEEAETVRRIYRMYMSGKTEYAIAKALTDEGVSSPAGKPVWRASTVKSILSNEKYRGSAILQKKFTVDFLSKKMKVNEGEVPQYYVEESHEAIISPEEWNAVKTEMIRRKELGRQYSGHSVLAAKIVCGECGSFYGAKTWHSTDKYKKTVWQCNCKFSGEHHCSTPTLDENDVKERFLSAFNQIFDCRESILEACRIAQAHLTDCTEIDHSIDGLRQETEVVAGLIRKCVDENAANAQDQDAYEKKYAGLTMRYEKIQKKLTNLQTEKQRREYKADNIGAFMFALHERTEPLTKFDDRLWLTVIDTVTAYNDGRLIFKFRNGAEIEG